jgi:tetratricopeptide (TPR) repeat protein
MREPGQRVGLFEALDHFVGAGLLAAAPAVGCALPPSATAEGYRFAALLRGRGEGEPIGAILDTLAREIWLSLEAKGLPLTMAEEHARTLADVIAAHPPAAREIAAAIAAPDAASRVAVAAAADVVQRARQAGALAAGRLDGELAGVLVERMLVAILNEPGLLASLRPAFEAFALSEADATSPSAGGGTVTPLRLVTRSEPAQSIGQRHPSPGLTASSGAPLASSPGSFPGAIAVDLPAETPAVVLAPLAAMSAQAERSERSAALSTTAIARLSRLLEAQSITPAERAERLDTLVAWLSAARAHLLKPSVDGADVTRLNARAAAALADADFSSAAVHLEQVRGRVREARRQAEARLQHELQDLLRRQGDEAKATASLAELALARLDFDGALKLFQDAAETLPMADRAGILHLLLRQADVALARCEHAGDVAGLAAAAQLYADVLGQAHAGGEHRIAAMADLGLGKILQKRAELGGDAVALEEAEHAFRRALSRLSRETDAALMAQAQAHLGNVLAMPGEREVVQRDANSGGRIESAVAAFQDALGLMRREDGPMRWALTQLKLGAACVRIGQETGSRRHWLAAAEAMMRALEVFEAHGAREQAELTRLSLRRVHERLPALLTAPGARG